MKLRQARKILIGRQRHTFKPYRLSTWHRAEKRLWREMSGVPPGEHLVIEFTGTIQEPYVEIDNGDGTMTVSANHPRLRPYAVLSGYKS